MTTGGLPTPPPPPQPPRRRIAVNTAIFALATGASRIAGLGREVVQAAFFNTSKAASAFTLASQVPNLFSNLFSQAALGAAFVPVFTEMLSEGRKRDAFKLASTLFWIILIGLGALTALWIAVAGLIVPLFTGASIPVGLTASLSRILFPVVLLLSLTGLLVGILQSYDEFTIPAIAPAVWNIVILVLLVALRNQFHQRIYAYAVAWLVATVVQLLMAGWALRRIDFRLGFQIDWRDPRGAAGADPVPPGDDEHRDRQPRHLHQCRLWVAGVESCAGGDQQRVPDLHAAPRRVQRRGRDRPVPDAHPHGRPA